MKGAARVGLLAAWAACAVAAPAIRAQQPTGRDAVEALGFDPLSFDPPDPERHEVAGVRVLFLENRSLPLIHAFVRFRGGSSFFGRGYFAAGTALPSLLRYGGTAELPPDSVDVLLEHYAIQTSFGGSGETVFSSMNALTEHFERALALWGRMLREPRFDTAQVEVWRGQEIESVRRRADDPARLAFSEFNRLLYGDHPIGWEMAESDLEPEDLTQQRLHELHRRVLCSGNMVLGVTGDVGWRELRPMVESLVIGWPTCADTLPSTPVPEIRREAGVFLLEKELEQSVVVMAHPTDVHLADDPDYFAATIGNSILGGGGFSSRLLARVRTEQGYAYSASSLWTTPRRHDGLLGAITRTAPENTVPAIRLILETMEELRAEPPTEEDVGTAVDRIANGFVFAFHSPAQIVARQMFYLEQDLPLDWLDRYLRGVQRVTPASVHRAFAEHLRPEEMTILVLGDPERMGRAGLEALGVVRVLEGG